MVVHSAAKWYVKHRGTRFDIILTGTNKDAVEEDPADRLESDDSAGVR